MGLVSSDAGPGRMTSAEVWAAARSDLIWHLALYYLIPFFLIMAVAHFGGETTKIVH